MKEGEAEAEGVGLEESEGGGEPEEVGVCPMLRDGVGVTVGEPLALELTVGALLPVKEPLALLQEVALPEVRVLGVGKGEPVAEREDGGVREALGLPVKVTGAVGEWVGLAQGVEVREDGGVRVEDAEPPPPGVRVAEWQAEPLGERGALREALGQCVGLKVRAAEGEAETQTLPLLLRAGDALGVLETLAQREARALGL